MQSKPTLTATSELLLARTIDGRPQYLTTDDAQAAVIRTALRGGTYALLGREHWEALCPWCNRATVTVLHLLQDCRYWRRQRTAAQDSIKQYALKVGCMPRDFPTGAAAGQQEAHFWYLLMVGAPVPLTVLDLPGVFPSEAPGSVARMTRVGAPPPASLHKYHVMLDKATPFVRTVIQATQAAFGIVPITTGAPAAKARQQLRMVRAEHAAPPLSRWRRLTHTWLKSGRRHVRHLAKAQPGKHLLLRLKRAYSRISGRTWKPACPRTRAPRALANLLGSAYVPRQSVVAHVGLGSTVAVLLMNNVSVGLCLCVLVGVCLYTLWYVCFVTLPEGTTAPRRGETRPE